MARRMSQNTKIMEKEQVILDYLYEEGPTTTDELIEAIGSSLGYQSDWFSKTLTILRIEGRIENETIRGKSYWMLPD